MDVRQTGDTTEGTHQRLSVGGEVALVLLLFLGFGAVYGLTHLSDREEQGRKHAAQTQTRHLETAIIAFKADQGRWPSTLEELAGRPATAKSWPSDGYLDDVPEDPWGRRYMYRRPGVTGRSFNITSPGPDGVPGTPDDISR